jgi:CRP/FNR family transcriptional regulator, nitrogen fixation regulation protein
MFFTDDGSSTPASSRAATDGQQSATASVDTHLGAARAYARDEVIFWEGERATSYYRVATGAVRSCKFLGDGRRQIVAFHIVDEIFGLDGGPERRFSAEAVNAAKVVAFPRSSAAESDWAEPRVAPDVVTAAALAGLERAQEHATLLGRKLAPERVASFLLDMAERVHSDAFELPMSRADIADYLGLTTETVSRTLCQFARDALIQMSAAKRGIVLTDKVALHRLHDGGLPLPSRPRLALQTTCLSGA